MEASMNTAQRHQVLHRLGILGDGPSQASVPPRPRQPEGWFEDPDNPGVRYNVGPVTGLAYRTDPDAPHMQAWRRTHGVSRAEHARLLATTPPPPAGLDVRGRAAR
jgi:hypothetical protein